MANKTKKRRGRAVYEALLAKHEQSGLTLRAFAESVGVKPATLYAWNRRLRAVRAEERDEAGARFLPLRVAEVPGEPAAPAFELALGRTRVLSIPLRFDATELRRLLAVLEA